MTKNMKPVYSQIKLKYILNYVSFSTISTYLRQLKRISNCAALYRYQLPVHRKLIQWLSGPSPSLLAATDRPAVTGPEVKRFERAAVL